MSALCPTDVDIHTLTQQHSPDMKGGGEEGEGEEREEGERGEGEKEEGEEDDPLAQSTEDEVGTLLRSTLDDLESALQESRKLLGERDKELAQLKAELEWYKVQVAREIANKTKIAKLLDESLSHVQEMEESTLQWQLEVREGHQVSERQVAQLARERSRNRELLTQLEDVTKTKEEMISKLSSQLLERKEDTRTGDKNSSTSGATNEGLDYMTFHFLRQAVFHFLTDIHPEDHLRSISSILEFTPQERKAVYLKFAEHKK